MIVCCAANAPAANHQSPQSKGGYRGRFTIPRSMAVMQDSTATMLSRLLERNEAVGKKVKWIWTPPEPPPTPLDALGAFRGQNHVLVFI